MPESAVKKCFIRACINHGSMDLKKAEQIYNALCNASERHQGDGNQIKTVVQEIDNEIRQFEQTLCIIEHPINNVEYVVFGLLLDSKRCNLQLQYTDTEQKYFNKLLESLISNKDFCIKWIDIYKICDEIPGNVQHVISKQRAQELSNVWISQGYLLEKNNMIYLGPRSLVEYSNYFKIKFPDMTTDCSLCNKILYWNVNCAECNVKFHRNCIRKYLIKKSTCPACKKIWNTSLT